MLLTKIPATKLFFIDHGYFYSFRILGDKHNQQYKEIRDKVAEYAFRKMFDKKRSMYTLIISFATQEFIEKSTCKSIIGIFNTEPTKKVSKIKTLFTRIRNYIK
ncbi:MAG: hypothetical protein ACRCZB_04960 [Bacteroidales bacterium]